MIKNIFSLTLCCLTLIVGSDVFGQSHSQSTTTRQQRQLALGPIVSSAQQVSMDAIDHSLWNAILQKYVDQAGGVNYAALKASSQDSAALDSYIATLSSASMRTPASLDGQKAYWINAYNAVTVKGILQEYPTTSIRNHTSETGGYNIWKNLMLNVGGSQISLDSMEHKRLRPMGDPKVHFAIVCASGGCPRLLNQAYVRETLNAQLDANTRHFFSLPQNFQYDARTQSFKLSQIIDWFKTDFGRDQAAQLRAIAPYLPTQAAQAAANSNAVRVSYLGYSWQLNEQVKAMAGSQPKPGSQSK